MKITKTVYLWVNQIFVNRDGTFDADYVHATDWKPGDDSILLDMQEIEFGFTPPAAGEINAMVIAGKEAAMNRFCQESTAKMQAMQAEIQELKALSCDSPAVAQ